MKNCSPLQPKICTAGPPTIPSELAVLAVKVLFEADLAGFGCFGQSNELAIRFLSLLGAQGIATRSKDATRGSWHRY